MAVGDNALVPTGLGPGMVPTGFAERVLATAQEIDDAARLWDGATTLAGLAQKWNGHGKEKTEIKAAQMFCEILLGGLLGARPGPSDLLERDDLGRIIDRSPHADYGLDGVIPKQRISELQRLSRWVAALLDEVRNGARSRRSLLLLVDEWEAGERPEPTVDELDIRRGGFLDVLADVAPGTVTLVLTDPPYAERYLPLWDDLGAWSSSVLADGGSLVAYCGQSILPEALRQLTPHLRYWWTLALLHRQSQMLPGKFVSVGWKPLLWLVRGRRATDVMVPDRIGGSGARKTMWAGDDESDGDWAQGVDELAPIISGLTSPGDLIVDPFAGSGSVGIAALRYGRRFLGAEVRD